MFTEVENEFMNLLAEKERLEILLQNRKAKEKVLKSNAEVSIRIPSTNDEAKYRHFEPDNVNSVMLKMIESTTNVTFTNVLKNLISRNTFYYEADVITKVIKFTLKLKATIKTEIDFEIQQILVHLFDTEEYYKTEVSPWIDFFAQQNNFNMLIFCASNYSEQNLLRGSCINELIKNNFVSIKQCNADNGGIQIKVHSPKNTKHVYFTFEWSLKFFHEEYRFLHHFHNEIVKDDTFMADHALLCKKVNNTILHDNEVQGIMKEFFNAFHKRAVDKSLK